MHLQASTRTRFFKLTLLILLLVGPTPAWGDELDFSPVDFIRQALVETSKTPIQGFHGYAHTFSLEPIRQDIWDSIDDYKNRDRKTLRSLIDYVMRELRRYTPERYGAGATPHANFLDIIAPVIIPIYLNTSFTWLADLAISYKKYEKYIFLQPPNIFLNTLVQQASGEQIARAVRSWSDSKVVFTQPTIDRDGDRPAWASTQDVAKTIYEQKDRILSAPMEPWNAITIIRFIAKYRGEKVGAELLEKFLEQATTPALFLGLFQEVARSGLWSQEKINAFIQKKMPTFLSWSPTPAETEELHKFIAPHVSPQVIARNLLSLMEKASNADHYLAYAQKLYTSLSEIKDKTSLIEEIKARIPDPLSSFKRLQPTLAQLRSFHLAAQPYTPKDLIIQNQLQLLQTCTSTEDFLDLAKDLFDRGDLEARQAEVEQVMAQRLPEFLQSDRIRVIQLAKDTQRQFPRLTQIVYEEFSKTLLQSCASADDFLSLTKSVFALGDLGGQSIEVEKAIAQHLPKFLNWQPSQAQVMQLAKTTQNQSPLLTQLIYKRFAATLELESNFFELLTTAIDMQVDLDSFSRDPAQAYKKLNAARTFLHTALTDEPWIKPYMTDKGDADGEVLRYSVLMSHLIHTRGYDETARRILYLMTTFNGLGEVYIKAAPEKLIQDEAQRERFNATRVEVLNFYQQVEEANFKVHQQWEALAKYEDNTKSEQNRILAKIENALQNDFCSVLGRTQDAAAAKAQNPPTRAKEMN